MRYSFTSANLDGECIIGFDQQRRVDFIELKGNFNEIQYLFVFDKIIKLNEHEFIHFMEKYKGISLRKIKEDLSFERFYNCFANKVGNKKRAIKLWDAMTDGEKSECIASIPRYDRWLLQRQNIEKAYPETYLYQRRWENQFAWKK
ncbi:MULTISPECIES: hypothetical protein [Nostocales]|jgi:hypothetical protein|uniref:hypothetical protein n=1 Tax=Nostocales TaxID=1161 RepID=UPI00232BF792|nr:MULTISPECIES: hypothetical protein [Aphanizomenonaceae]MDB9473478.1 hypothetical protein [Dolichospermum circinale CS-537/11]MDB9500049.1 hypothetical protein [Nodularia spumigena CS-336/02]